MTARNASYNAALAPGASTTIGFQANHTGNTAQAGLLHPQRQRLHRITLMSRTKAKFVLEDPSFLEPN